jgi:hypothetical protein
VSLPFVERRVCYPFAYRSSYQCVHALSRCSCATPAWREQTARLRLGERHRRHAVRGHLHELGGDLPAAATAYADAARKAADVAERDHLVRQAARVRAAALGMNRA